MFWTLKIQWDSCWVWITLDLWLMGKLLTYERCVFGGLFQYFNTWGFSKTRFLNNHHSMTSYVQSHREDPPSNNLLLFSHWTYEESVVVSWFVWITFTMNIIIVDVVCAELVPFSHSSDTYWSGATNARSPVLARVQDLYEVTSS